jgi:hypothetical protein
MVPREQTGNHHNVKPFILWRKEAAKPVYYGLAIVVVDWV